MEEGVEQARRELNDLEKRHDRVEVQLKFEEINLDHNQDKLKEMRMDARALEFSLQNLQKEIGELEVTTIEQEARLGCLKTDLIKMDRVIADKMMVLFEKGAI